MYILVSLDRYLFRQTKRPKQKAWAFYKIQTGVFFGGHLEKYQTGEPNARLQEYREPS